jgi:hypothetical protein
MTSFRTDGRPNPRISFFDRMDNGNCDMPPVTLPQCLLTCAQIGLLSQIVLAQVPQ